MKRLIVCLIAVMLLFTACGRGAAQIPTQPEIPATVEVPTEEAIITSQAESATAVSTGNSAGETTAVSEIQTTADNPTSLPVTTLPTETTAGTTKEPPQTTAGKTTEAPKTTAPRTTEPQKTTAAPKTTAPPKTTQAPKTTAPPRTTVPAATVPPATTTPTTQSAAKTCTVRIECMTILDNLNKLKAGKADFVPKSGVILEDTAVALEERDTAFSVLKRACAEHVCTDNCRYCQANGIQMEYTFTPVFETYYIEGIHQIYEKDCGTMSGWMFSVNGRFPEEGASSITVSAGDRIVFCYTCDMGDDVGNHFEG